MIEFPCEPIAQRQKKNWGGKLPGSWQCYPSSAVSFLSNWIPAARSPEYYEAYVDDTEDSVGKPGLAEILRAQLRWPSAARSGEYAETHRRAIEDRLRANGFMFKVIFRTGLRSVAEIKAIMNNHNSPAILNTMLSGRGHVVLACGDQPRGLSIMDPFGFAPGDPAQTTLRGGYVNASPGPHLYLDTFLDKFARAADGTFWVTYATR